MTSKIVVQVGGSLADDLAGFVQAWKRVEAGDHGAVRILSFESWKGLASELTDGLSATVTF